MLQNYDTENGDKNITVTGGVWDFNNLEQAKNPIHFPFPNATNIFMPHHLNVYTGTVISFYNVKNLTLSHFTVKDPTTFAVTLNIVENFTAEDIAFDFNYGNPAAVNMDGIHLCGNCKFGVIRNIKGSCYDDMIALNADEGTPGPITDIQIDGLFSDDCHSAVRLLSADYPVERVNISNVYGSYYQYCIGITKYYEGDNGYFDAIVLKNIFASKAEFKPVYSLHGNVYTSWYPYIWVQSGLRVKNLSISEVYRKEKIGNVPTIQIDENVVIENLTLHNIVMENLLADPVPLIINKGVIETCQTSGLRNSKGEIMI